MKLFTVLILALLTAGPALAGLPDPDCPERRRNREQPVRTYYTEDVRPSGGWTYEGYNEYLGY